MTSYYLHELRQRRELLAAVQVVEVASVLYLDVRDAAVLAPHGEGEVARIALGGPGQEAGLVAALLEQRLRLDAVDVGVEPSARQRGEICELRPQGGPAEFYTEKGCLLDLVFSTRYISQMSYTAL